MRQCVTNTSYCLLFNGKSTNTIRPTRGLRQGGPFSPYLFILLGDGSLCQIEKVGRMKRLSGSELHHLLFADESFFFLRGLVENARELKTILTKYCNASTQWINNAKSNLVFTRGAAEGCCKAIEQKLQIRGNTWAFL